MAEFTGLITALATLLWPILGFTVIFLFKEDISQLSKRLKRGKILGQEVELSEALARLEQDANAVADEIPVLPVANDTNLSSAKVVKSEEAVNYDTIKEVLREAAIYPKAALMLLSANIEQELNKYMVDANLRPLLGINGRRSYSVRQNFKFLEQRGILPADLLNVVNDFWNIRNNLVHGGQVEPDDVLRAIDSGITILKTLKAIPIQTDDGPPAPE